MSIFKSKPFLTSIGAIIVACFVVVITIISKNRATADWVKNIENIEIKKVPVAERIVTPSAVKALYMTAWTASISERRNNLVKMVDDTELNSIVIDVKDYTGNISFTVTDPDLQKIGSSINRIKDIKEFLAELKKKEIYSIARIAIFQDLFLSGKRPDLAVKQTNGSVWYDYKKISWLDPCSKEVWDYTIKIAKEAINVGFDEINFDYVRFPSDGNLKNIAYTFCKKEIEKEDAMENFFKYLSRALKRTGHPISIDLFGFTTTRYDDMNIGQLLETAAPYFDCIAPMVYPSHYPSGYNGYANPAEHPYEVVKIAMDTASKRLINQAAGLPPNSTTTASLSNSQLPKYPSTQVPNSKLRPWLQDFDMGADYTGPMIRKQIQATYDAGLTGWMLWNASNNYTREALLNK